MIQTAPPRRTLSRPSARLVPAVERAVRLLRLLASDGGPRRLTDLSRTLVVSKSTLSELLGTLEYLGLVERDSESRTYRLGYGVLELGNAVLRRLDLRQVARPYLTQLRDAIGETAVLHMPVDQGALIVDRVESDHQLKVVAPIGHRLPPFAGSVAKVFAAQLADGELAAVLRTRALRAFTPRSITSAQRYRKEIQRVRRHGSAVDDEEYLPGVRAISAPVLDSRGRTVATVTVVGSSVRLTDVRMRRAVTAVLEAAASVSRRLGAPAYPRAAARRQRTPVGG